MTFQMQQGFQLWCDRKEIDGGMWAIIWIFSADAKKHIFSRFFSRSKCNEGEEEEEKEKEEEEEEKEEELIHHTHYDKVNDAIF